ncbi:MAG: hypothetical protein CL398_01810 [Acidiferrobacteraceae bacterium]|nr:hypothetical protein [Acidiferrobacteraceae bacterium]
MNSIEFASMKVQISSLSPEKTRMLVLSEEQVRSFRHYGVCPTCCTAQDPVCLTRLGWFDWKSKLEVVQCQNCDSIYYANPPDSEQIDKYYQEHWNKAGGKNIESDAHVGTAINRKMQRLLDNFCLAKDSTRILDVGCGLGGMLAGLSESGYSNFYGLEQSHHRFAAAAKRYPGRIFDCGYRDLNDEYLFDVIYCNHVLEHIYKPSDYFEWLDDRLTHNGVAIVCVPNVQWEQLVNQILYIPHLHSFSAKSLKKAGERVGFTSVFWLDSDRKDDLCAIFFKNSDTYRCFEHINLNSTAFADLDDFPDISLSSQKDRFKNIWARRLGEEHSKTLINWPSANNIQLVDNDVQRWDSYTVWRSQWRAIFCLLLFRKRFAFRVWPQLNRGEGLINRLLSTPKRHVTDYNHLVFTTLGNTEDGIPEITYRKKAPILMK